MSRGHHEASWRHPAASPLRADRYPLLRRTGAARRGRAVRFASSSPTSWRWATTSRRRRAPGWSRSPCWRRWPGATSRIGLIATCSTTYTEPFNLARQFASLDHISGGRVGWNIVTSWLATAARNFGGDGAGQPRRPLRARRGVHAGRQGAVGQLGRRRGARRPRQRALRRCRSHPPDRPRGRALSRSPGRSTCRAGRRAGRCSCRPAPPRPAAASPRAMPRRCSPRRWRRPRRRTSTPI